jgi:hypothetical protein
MEIIKNFITGKEVQDIKKFVDATEQQHRRGPEKRWVFGTRYGGNHVSEQIPEFIIPIMERLNADVDSVVFTKYQEGKDMRWHTDSLEAGPVIYILNVYGKAILGFRDENNNEKEKVEMNNADLLILSGEERMKWQHCVYPVEKERVSIVFRKRTPIL